MKGKSYRLKLLLDSYLLSQYTLIASVPPPTTEGRWNPLTTFKGSMFSETQKHPLVRLLEASFYVHRRDPRNTVCQESRPHVIQVGNGTYVFSVHPHVATILPAK